MKSKNSEVILENSDEVQSNVIVEIVEYEPGKIVWKTVIKKYGGKLSFAAFSEGEKFCETTAEYDIYVQVIDGQAQVTIGDKDWDIKLGEGMIIPVNTVHCFKAKSKFKMICTIVRI